MEQQWKSPNGKPIQLPIVEEIRQALLRERATGAPLRLCIGTDSQVKAGITAFATVIVLLRAGNGGNMYVRKERSTLHMGIKQRMLLEVAKSIETAYQLGELSRVFRVPMEIHADINTHAGFKSNVALQDAMGYSLGMGYTFKAKPYAFASSSCANKMVQ